MAKKSTKLEIYIHFPFCKKKCNYCDFLSGSDHLNKDEMDLYVDKLLIDIKDYAKKVKGSTNKKYVVSSIFIGGGTPSLIEPMKIKEIIDSIKDEFVVSKDIEITMEINPESLTLLKAKGYYLAGINRVSIGLQSIHKEELEALGRIHDFDTFKDAIFFLRIAKINNINVDLMYGIPGQTLDTWEETVKVVAAEPVTHISAYSLIIEEGTPFFERKDKIEKKLPDEDTIIEMGRTCQDILENRKFKRYEISNYAKKGFECKHNLGYWDLTEYIGFGIGASSYFMGERFSNTKDFNLYIMNSKTENLKEIERQQSIEKDMEEFMFLGLRKIDGISKSDFNKKFNKDIYDVYGEVIEKFVANKLLIDSEDTLKLARKAIDISNTILCDFLLV